MSISTSSCLRKTGMLLFLFLMFVGGSAQTVRTSVLVDEDFSKMTKGSIESPDTTSMLGDYYGESEDDAYFNNEYTHAPGWAGDCVYQAGGAIAMLGYADWSPSILDTPINDFSGHLKVSFRLKPIPALNKQKDGVTRLTLACCYKNIAYAKIASQDCYSENFDDDEWYDLEYEIENFKSNNDGFIQLGIYGAAIIDDFKVVSTDDFIANPVLSDATGFTKDGGFSVSWNKTRLADDYQFSLYKKVLDEGADSTRVEENFDGEGIDRMITTDGTIAQGEGIDGGNALKLTGNQTLESVVNNGRIRHCTFSIKLVCPEDKQADLSFIHIWCRNLNGTYYDSYYRASYYLNNFKAFEMQYATYDYFDDVYYGIKFDTTDLPDGAYLLIEDLDFTLGRGSSFQKQKFIENGKSVDYATLTDTHYTVCTDNVENGLDPESEYYYTVVSHSEDLVSDALMQHAFGLTAPDVLPATGIDSRGSYTANWQKAAKATSYVVNTYGVYTAEGAENEHLILDEDFSRANEDWTSVTDWTAADKMYNEYSETSLDDFTNDAGWGGIGNTIMIGGVGCDASDQYSQYYIATPYLYLANNDKFSCYIDAYGTPNTPLNMRVGDVDYNMYFPSAGHLYGWFDGIPVPGDGKNIDIIFYDATNHNAFMINELKVAQDLNAGDNVYTYLKQDVVSAPDCSFVTNSLGKYDYDVFAYTVTSKELLDSETATSVPSEYVLVDLANGESHTGINDVTENTTKTNCYNIAGQRVRPDTQGLIIQNGRKYLIK